VESLWTGDVESAFFNSAIFDKRRVLQLPEYKNNGRTNAKGYYVLGIDVGRKDCTTEVVVIKVTPAPTGVPRKQIVNIYSYEAEHFGLQAIHIKRLFNQFNCRAAVVDGNGLGHGLVDMLTMDQEDPDTGEMLWNWGVINDEDGDFRKMRTAETITDAMYIMKASAPLNTEMYSYCQSQMRNGKILFLIDDNVAKGKLLDQVQGKKMSPVQRAEYLKPYVQTNILKDQMLNLIEETEGINIILKPHNKKIKHDKFSASIKIYIRRILMVDFTIRRENDKYNGRIIWSSDQIDYIIKEYANGTTMKSLGKQFDVKYETIRLLLHKYNIKTRGNKHNYPRIENIFSTIDTREKAYWLGVLYADGSIKEKSNEISLGLSDKDHVEKFKNFIGASNHRIQVIEPNDKKNKLTKNFYMFSIRDAQIHSDLIKHGCLPNKNHLNLHIPKDMLENLKIDFIRGYFDGDGGFYFAKNKYKKDRLVITFAGSKTMMQDIKEYFGIVNALEQNINSKDTYTLRTNNRKKVLEIINLIYRDTSDSIRLNRKYQTYLNYIGA
jgi:hypothetical protein